MILRKAYAEIHWNIRKLILLPSPSKTVTFYSSWLCFLHLLLSNLSCSIVSVLGVVHHSFGPQLGYESWLEFCLNQAMALTFRHVVSFCWFCCLSLRLCLGFESSLISTSAFLMLILGRWLHYIIYFTANQRNFQPTTRYY